MTDLPIEKKFEILSQITRASHFAWREAALRLCPELDPMELVNEMWDITGVETGKAYLKRLTPGDDLPKQVAASIVWSSRTMGEDAILEEDETPGVWIVKHEGCPWVKWHERLGLLPEDRPGCDTWFRSTIRTINEALETNVKFETTHALPDGDPCCRRRIWQALPAGKN